MKLCEIITKFSVRNNPHHSHPALPSLHRGPVKEVRSQSQGSCFFFLSLEVVEVGWDCLALHLPWLAQVLLSQDRRSTSRGGHITIYFLLLDKSFLKLFSIQEKMSKLGTVLSRDNLYVKNWWWCR